MYASEKVNKFVLTLLLLLAVAVTSSSSFSLKIHPPSKFSVHLNHEAPKLASSSMDTSIRQTREGRLLERAPPNEGPIQTASAHGWEINYRQYFSFIIPVQVVASVLEEFYTDCLQQIALQIFQNRPAPGNTFTVNIGSVFLALEVADPTQGLGWAACEIIVHTLLMNVRTGFTAQFKSEWFNPETNKLVYVSLSMLQRFGPGRAPD